MWEQFSYFGMRALLVYYMTKAAADRPGDLSLIYGTYTACAYFTPIIGGVIADRLLGKRRAIIIGASVMAAGHFMMGFENLLYVALATIALGNGLFLPTLPSQINDLYAEDDPRRGWAYNVYYLGINIGGFLAPLLCGTLGEIYGWHSASGGGLRHAGRPADLSVGQRYLPAEQSPVTAEPGPAGTTPCRLPTTVLVLVGVALSVTVFRGAYEQAATPWRSGPTPGSTGRWDPGPCR
jgi:POT family proton-dependent oligopeptide transporter